MSSIMMRRSAQQIGKRALKGPGRLSPTVAIRELGNLSAEDEKLVVQRAEQAKRELVILAECFRRYDGDGDGHLDRAEMSKVLKDLDLPAATSDVDEMFKALDRDENGSIQLTDWLDYLPKGSRVSILNKWDPESMSAADEHRTVRIELPSGKIIYTFTDEAPALATYSLLPIVSAYLTKCNVTIEKKDISVASRIISNFPDYLQSGQQEVDHLAMLGDLSKTPEANIIKLPNVSASIPQLQEAIEELQSLGYAVPDFPADPQNNEERKVRERYGAVLGSAVNPVLREGNSDRRVAAPVKAFARENPHRLKPWDPNSKSHVSHMDDNDFFSAEQSHVMPTSGDVQIKHVDADTGLVTVLKTSTKLLAGEVIDTSKMSVKHLREFYAKEMADAKDKGVLFSLHLKATMMKISDPIMFGHAVSVFFDSALTKHSEVLAELGVNLKNGLGDLEKKITSLPEAQRAEIEADIAACYENGPALAMVDSAKGITNLHSPNDVIIDASMPPAVRDGGKMWNKADELEDTKMTIPDRCYAGIYNEVIEFSKTHGAFDVSKMGSVSNVGLMAQKAEEYGSHDKTFEIERSGTVQVIDKKTGSVLMSHEVEEGDIWRMCQTKDSPIQDWVKLAVSRARSTGDPALFWLNGDRAHDRNLIAKVEDYLALHDTQGLDIRILAPEAAMRETLERTMNGDDTISVTGNVLRDYLTDLFPILELGTSAKMLSIVPLLAGGGLFETGAGGSAPKHVQQFEKEGHLRWDSLGEFLALAVSLEDLASKTNNHSARVLADTLNEAISELLSKNKSPSRKVHEIDNRGSHFYLAMYWSQRLAAQSASPELAGHFTSIAEQLTSNEDSIMAELNNAQGSPQDLGGYYFPNPAKAEKAMRPSQILNDIINSI